MTTNMTITRSMNSNIKPKKVKKEVKRKLVNNKQPLHEMERIVENNLLPGRSIRAQLNLREEAVAKKRVLEMVRKEKRSCLLGNTSNGTRVHIMFLSKNGKFFEITKSFFGTCTAYKIPSIEDYIKDNE